MVGKGKYDDACTVAREQTQARGVVLIVFNGTDGSGFSCQADLETLLTLPEILEQVAQRIRRDTTVPQA